MSCQVKAIDLLQTTFARWDGQLFYAPNSVLATKYIYNVRRSQPQMEVFEINIAMHTPNEKLVEFRSKLVKYLENDSREYLPNLDIMCFAIKVLLTCCMPREKERN